MSFLEKFCQSIAAKLEQIASRSSLILSGRQWMHAPPVPMDAQLGAIAARSCISRGLGFRTMYSGAGHDAQLFAPVCPTAMIFVPSRQGISHSSEEHTEPEQLGAGIAVLTDVLYALAYEEGSA
jgi:allantoate deiminase